MDFALTKALEEGIDTAKRQGFRPGRMASTPLGEEVEIKSFPYSDGENVLVLVRMVTRASDFLEWKTDDLELS